MKTGPQILPQLMGIIIALALAIVVVGCGGGGGKYYPPCVALNSTGIGKTPCTDTPGDLTHQQVISEQRENGSLGARIIEGEKYYYFRDIAFAGDKVTLAVPIDKWISIVDSNGTVVTKLSTPRYTRDAVAVELTHPQRKPILAVLIDQQSPSHSSTLYLLDSSFTPIYKEHLLGAHWIAKQLNPAGDRLLISTEAKWIPKDKWITIGGNWQYNVFCESK